MTEDIKSAFEHPSVRSELTAVAPLDRISVRDLIKSVEIGAFQAERGTTQRISFNVVVEVPIFDKAIADDVDQILSYDKISESVDAALNEERLNLLETLAENVADRILLLPQAQRVFVRIEKLDRGESNLGVEIVRTRDIAVQTNAIQDVLEPIVVFMTNAVLLSDHLQSWIDAAEQAANPVVFCVGQSDQDQVKCQSIDAQNRFDLLDAEQNAWLFADADPRLTVVGTRAELDWGLRNGQVGIWAMSKMVLDAVNGPLGRDMGEIVTWFAREMSAVKIVVAGDPSDITVAGATFQPTHKATL